LISLTPPILNDLDITTFLFLNKVNSSWR
jgi:hypothetical protein